MTQAKEYSPKRFAISSVSCPSCRAKLDRDSKWCGTCGFTGAKSIELFGENSPPLIPILDVANFWDAKHIKKIESAIIRFNKRFPQIRWRLCAVTLPPETNLSLFGFWMMNVCPLAPEETAEDREWTVLFVVNAETGHASVTTGYSAEVWLADDMWDHALAETVEPFRRNRPDQAIVSFLNVAREHFERAWKRSRKQLAKSSRK